MDKADIIKAKKSLKQIIQFIESIISHLNKKEENIVARALLASFCIDRYFDEGLAFDLKKLMLKYSSPDNEQIKE